MSIGTESSVRLRQSHPVKTFAKRGFAVLLVLLIVWLALEIFLRVAFDILPPGVRGAIQNVQRYPWSDERIVPFLPLTANGEWGVYAPVGLKDFPINAIDARYTVSTISIWDGHIAGFRSAPARYPLDVLVFGDSFSFCSTSFEDCWVQRLSALGKWNVFNAGIVGTGPLGQYKLMQGIAPPTKPSVIIWQWFPNDVPDDYNLARIRGDVGELAGPPSPDPEPHPTGIARISAIAALVERVLNPIIKHSPYKHFQQLSIDGRMMLLPTNEYPSPYSLQYKSTRYGLERNLDAYAEGEQLAHDMNALMVHVFIPTKEEVFAESLKSILGQKYLDELSAARLDLLSQCNKRGWRCIDALPALRAAYQAGDTVYYGYESHLDSGGNRVLAELVYNYLVDNKLLAPKGN